MATHCSHLAWEIPRTEEPGGLQSIGLQRAGHDSSDLTRTPIPHHTAGEAGGGESYLRIKCFHTRQAEYYQKETVQIRMNLKPH